MALKPLYEKGCFTKSKYLKIRSSGLQRGILYGQAKVQKPVKDNCPSFCHILLEISTPTYDLAIFPVPILNSLTRNKYTLHDLLSFSKSKFNSKNLISSLDVENLFINIPLKETNDDIINDF